ncbi:MAG: hypothetical protein CMH56_00350 [Myxococcales bacterium]|nr:hypothetical protein [Myxococcales bacterium]
MTGKTPGVRGPSGFGLFTMVQIMCLLLVSVLGLWWGLLLSRQHGHLKKLNAMVDEPVDLGSLGSNFESMVFWEGGFFVLVVALTLIMSGILYWRDVKRIKTLEIFFASMTHELKTPLASIRLQTEAIQESISPGHKGQKWVDRLLQDVSRLEHQVGNTLELARLTGGGELFLETIDLQYAFDDLTRLWLPNFENQLAFDVKDVFGEVKADRHALVMILNNIIANAIKHSGQSPVTLQITSEHYSGETVLKLKDNGNGCSNEKLTQVTQLFERTGDAAGTGVGLYLVHSLMTKMDGVVTLDAANGFEVALRFQTSDGDH